MRTTGAIEVEDAQLIDLDTAAAISITSGLALQRRLTGAPTTKSSLYQEAGSDRFGGAPDRLACLSAKELEVLGLMAEGLTDSAIATKLHLARRTVETHIGSLFTKLDLLPTDDDHRRLGAVLTYLHQTA